MLSLQSCPTLCDPIDGSPPGSPVPGILQARTLEWVAISFSNACKWKVKVKSLSRVRLLATPWTAAYQAPPSMGFSRQEYWSGVPLPSPEVVYCLPIVETTLLQKFNWAFVVVFHILHSSNSDIILIYFCLLILTYLFLAVLVFHCCTDFSLVAREQGLRSGLGARASACRAVSYCGAGALGCAGCSSCTWAQ